MKFQNKQLYSECQMVSALNAAYKLGQPFIKMGSNEYERMVDLVGARHGSAICVEKVYEYLRLKYIDLKPTFESVKFAMEKGFPISLSVWTDNTGFHSVVIVDKRHDNKRGGYQVKVPNLRRETDKGMWIHWEDFLKIIATRPNLYPEKGYFRMFYLNPMFDEEIPKKKYKLNDQSNK